jgi:hypothetical protein
MLRPKMRNWRDEAGHHPDVLAVERLDRFRITPDAVRATGFGVPQS